MYDLRLSRFAPQCWLASLALLVVLPALALAQPQPYPSKPIRLILPFAAGGGADNNARTMTEQLSQRLGQPIIIDYKPGAGGTLGANIVANASPDGYTLLYATPGQQMTNPHLMDKMPYDPIKSFSSVSQVIQGSNVLVVNTSVRLNRVNFQ